MTLLLCLLLAAPPLPAPAEPAAQAPAGAYEGAWPGASHQAIDVPLAGYDAGAVREPSSKDAWGGERDGKTPLSDRVASYQIKARLDPKKHTLDASEKLLWKNRSAVQIHSVYLHLYLNAFESTGSTFMREKGKTSLRGLGPEELKKQEWGYQELKKATQGGRPLKWSFVHPDGGPDTDHTVVRLDLAEPVAPGATAELEIDFHDQLPRVVARSGYFGNYHLVAQWFPKIGVLELPGERGATAPRWNVHEFHLHSEFYADFGNYDVEVTAPKGYTVGATGEEQGPPRESSDGLTHRFTQEDVHDFAWTAWDGFKSVSADWTHAGSPKARVTVLYPAEYEVSAQPALQSTLQALTYFSDTLGPYPYKTVTVVIPPYNSEESGGMEYPTFFTTVGSADYSPELPFVDFVTIHEFGHGYYYGLLATNEFEEPFLDEGMNEFWDARMLEARGDRIRISNSFLRRLGIRLTPPLSWFDFERLNGALRLLADPLADSSWHRAGSFGYVYSGTATWFRDLEQKLGGDVLARAYKEYYRRWKFRHPSTADLREVLSEVSGQPRVIAEFFADHVYATQGLDDRVTKLESEEALPEVGFTDKAGLRTEREQDAIDKQVDEAHAAYRKAHPEAKKKDGPGPYPYRTTVLVRRLGAQVDQEVLVQFADGSEQRFAWPKGERWHKYELTTPTRAVSAQLDPGRKIFADWNKLDDGRTVEAHPLASRRYTLEAGAWLQLVLALVEAL